MFFMIALTLGQVQTVMYGIWGKMFLVVPDSFQWTLAILLPLYKDLHIWVIMHFGSKCINGDEQSMKIACTMLRYANHSLFLTYIVGGSIANLITQILMLVTDFLTNVFSSVYLA